MRKKKIVPKRHRFKLNDRVIFLHAGSFRAGTVIELTNEVDGHATYTVRCLGIGRIYPCLGIDGSKDYYVMSKETKEMYGQI